MLPVRIILCLLLLYLFSTLTLAAPGSVTVLYQVVDNFPVKYVAVNLHDPDVVITLAVATAFPYGLDSWKSFLNRLQPDAMINGSYFCPISHQPVSDVAVNGSLLYRGNVGTALCIGPDNHVVFLSGPHQTKTDWTGFRTVICAGPRLLTDGQLTINPRAEGFRDPHVLGSAPRSAIALRADGLLLLLTIETNISLQNLANVCRKLGAIQAMALDGGSSSGLYANGRTLTMPARTISNTLAVYTTRQHYAAIAHRLLPTNITVLASLLPANIVTNYFPKPPITSVASKPRLRTLPISLVKFLKPEQTKTVQGPTTVLVQIAPGTKFEWATLRVDDQLRAMVNTSTIDYAWDSSKETDGRHILEVLVWAADQSIVAAATREVIVQNAPVVAIK